jgi:hypothetical protein
LNTYGEYRAYQYIVKDKITQSDAKIITSSLNPTAYLAYNGSSSVIEVDLLRTWICPGHTGFKKDICPSPYKKLSMQEFIK